MIWKRVDRRVLNLEVSPYSKLLTMPPMPTPPSSVSIECASGYKESMEKSRRQKIDTAILQQVSNDRFISVNKCILFYN